MCPTCGADIPPPEFSPCSHHRPPFQREHHATPAEHKRAASDIGDAIDIRITRTEIAVAIVCLIVAVVCIYLVLQGLAS